jgi:folylpolyglutamate synthase/dihydropteroate synthase
VLFGAAAGKRWREGLSALLPIADAFVVTELSGTASEDPAAIAAFLGAHGRQTDVVADVAAGVLRLRERPGPRVVTGSFYLAGAVRALVDMELRTTSDDRPT